MADDEIDYDARERGARPPRAREGEAYGPGWERDRSDKMVPSRTWRATIAQADDEIEAIRRRYTDDFSLVRLAGPGDPYAVHPDAHREAKHDVRTLLAEVDRLRAERDEARVWRERWEALAAGVTARLGTWETVGVGPAVARVREDAAEDMRRRAVEVCARAGETGREGVDGLVYQDGWKDAAHHLADEIAALPLTDDATDTGPRLGSE